MTITVMRPKQNRNYSNTSARRATWQQKQTATGSPAMCVGAVSILTPSAVTLPPNP